MPPLVRIARTEARIPIDANQPSAREHALHVMRCLRHSGYQPGDVIPYQALRDIYHEICDRLNWQARGWSGQYGMGSHLRKLCGGRKPYHHSWRGMAEPTYSLTKRGPVYILPRWEDVPGLTDGPASGPARSSSRNGGNGGQTVALFPRSGSGSKKRRAAA